MQKSMNDYYNNLKGDICKLGLALVTLVVCLNLAVSTLNNGTRKLYEAAEKYGIELEEPDSEITQDDTQDKAPVINRNISVNLEVNLLSISLAGLVPMLLLAVKKVRFKLTQKRKESVNIFKLQ